MPAKKRAMSRPRKLSPESLVFLLCNKVAQTGNGNTYEQVFDQAVTAGFPVVASFSVVSTVGNGFGPFRHWVKLVGPGLDISTDEALGILANKHSTHNIFSRFEGLAFPQEGLYEFQMFINGVEVAKTYLRIKAAMKQGIAQEVGTGG